jgi:hypothetical protein
VIHIPQIKAPQLAAIVIANKDRAAKPQQPAAEQKAVVLTP